jgi:hypothetical protein
MTRAVTHEKEEDLMVTKRKLTSMVVALMCLRTAQLSADQISFQYEHAKVTAAESADGAPLNGDVNRFFITTDGDILSVNDVLITLPTGVSLYNNPLGDAANAHRGQPVLIPAFPALGVDTWIQTPGNTVRVGPDLPGDGTTTFRDLTNDGLQSNFIFAQLTIPAATPWIFSGRISIASQTSGAIFSQDFSFTNLPEPTGLGMVGIGAIGLLAAGRRRS